MVLRSKIYTKNIYKHGRNIMMELLSQYVSSSSQSKSCDDKLQPAKVSSVYLIMYSQADLSIFPDRQLFADGVCEGIELWGTKIKIYNGLVARKTIKSKEALSHHHSTKQDQAVAADMAIFKEQVECLHYSVWLYTTKEDEDFIQSAGHPDLPNSGPPRTMAAS